MLGIGRKETDYVKEATQAVESLSTDVIATLPEVLQTRLAGLSVTVDHYRWLGTVKPEAYNNEEEIKRLLRSDEGEIKAINRLARVLGANYKPYELPSGYYVAEWGERSWRRLFRHPSPVSDLRFRPPMLPIEIMVKYGEADEAGLFDRFLVASPEWWQNFDSDDTRMTRKVMLPVVVVGVIPENVYKPVGFGYTEKQLVDPKGKRPVRQRPDAPGCIVIDGTCFLIAALPPVNL